MAPGDIQHVDGPDAFGAAFAVSRETLDKLVAYERLLMRWQKTINLVAASTLGDVWHRHFADSAQLVRHAPPSARSWLDLGSGAGFPGLVLAILNSEKGDAQHVLIESDSRKAAFLREASRVTATPVDILCTRIECIETRARVSGVSCVTARALAPMPRLVSLIAPFISKGATGLLLKGREIAAELEEAERSWDMSYELRPSLTEATGRVLLLKALKAKTEG